MGKTILVTGGLGYIGSHICVELLKQNYQVVATFVNLKNQTKIIEAINKITKKNIDVIETDFLENGSINNIFKLFNIDSVIHLYGSKSILNSIKKPLIDYKKNVVTTLNLLEVMQYNQVNKIIFSSSSSVYGNITKMPITEVSKLYPNNPYSKSKVFIENVLSDLSTNNTNFKALTLRYFNPAGAHNSGLIGESVRGVPNNLMSYIPLSIMGIVPKLKVFGSNYATRDGSCIRDYVHVCDIAKATVNAVKKLDSNIKYQNINICSNNPYSVFEVIQAFSKVIRQEILFEIKGKRQGDIAISYGDNNLAKELLNWKATAKLSQMCKDTWRWYSQNYE